MITFESKDELSVHPIYNSSVPPPFIASQYSLQFSIHDVSEFN